MVMLGVGESKGGLCLGWVRIPDSVIGRERMTLMNGGTATAVTSALGLRQNPGWKSSAKSSGRIRTTIGKVNSRGSRIRQNTPTTAEEWGRGQARSS